MQPCVAFRVVRLLVLAAWIISLSACGGNSGSATPSPTPTPSPSPTPVPSAHLYVTAGAQAFQFTLPVTSTSTPSVTFSTPFAPMAVDSSGNVAGSDGFGNVAIYNAPLSNSSVPSLTFRNGNFTTINQMGFDAQGNLYVSGSASNSAGVNIFKPPFSSSSTPSQTVSITGTLSAVDLIGNLYLSVTQNAPRQCLIEVLAPPYSGMPAITNLTCGEDSFPGFMAVTNTQLFVAHDLAGGLLGSVDVFGLPSISSGFSISLPELPGVMAVDSNGNLYVAEINPLGPQNGTILVYTSPLSSSSTPAVTLAFSNTNTNSIFNIVVGP